MHKIKSYPLFFLVQQTVSLGNCWLQLPFHGHKLGHLSQQKFYFNKSVLDSHALVSVNSNTEEFQTDVFTVLLGTLLHAHNDMSNKKKGFTSMPVETIVLSFEAF